MPKEKKWILKDAADKETVSRLASELGVDPVLALLLVQRGVATFQEARAFFRPDLKNLHDPFLMTDMDRAVLTLCSMKYMESKLPKVDFIRVHRSFIIQKRYIRAVGNNNIQLVNGREIPVGDAYRKQLNDYLSCQMC